MILFDPDKSDRNFLIWLHERLEHVHGENDLVGYMHRLRRIIADMPADKKSVKFSHNSLDDLKGSLDNP